MIKDNKILIISFLSVTIIVVLLIIFFKTFFVKYEKEIRSLPSAKAIQNPFLAATRFLVQIGVDAESVSDRSLLLKLPDVNDLIIINRFDGNLPEKSEDKLISWIKHGGKIILAANRFWDEDLLKTGNNLLDRYNIRPLIKPVKEEAKKDQKQCEVNPEKPVFKIRLNSKKYANISFFSDRILEDPDEIGEKAYSNDMQKHIIQIKIGQGCLIVLSDNEFLKNSNIDKNDHAYFLMNLIKDRSKIWLLYSSNMPSLLSLIWNSAHWFVICFLFLLLFCLFRLNLKSGPLILEESTSSRNLMEHLEASGNYLFKRDKGSSMVKKVQKSTERFLKERYLFTKETSRSQMCARLGKWTDIPANSVHDALFGNVGNEHDFINKSVVLHHLTNSIKRKSYTHE